MMVNECDSTSSSMVGIWLLQLVLLQQEIDHRLARQNPARARAGRRRRMMVPSRQLD